MHKRACDLEQAPLVRMSNDLAAEERARDGMKIFNEAVDYLAHAFPHSVEAAEGKWDHLRSA